MSLYIDEIQNMTVCEKCGVAFNYTFNSKCEPNITAWPATDVYRGKCPCCKKPFEVCE